MRFILYLKNRKLYVQSTLILWALTCLTLLTSGVPKHPPGRKVLLGLASATWIEPGRPMPKYPLFLAPPKREKAADTDPIRFTIQPNRQSIRLGETVDLTISAELLNISPSLLFTLPGANAYRLKLLLPEGFEQTGGDFVDYIGDQLTYPGHATVTYHVTGYFTSLKPGSSFQLLRSHSQADNQSLFVEKAALTVQPLDANSLTTKPAGPTLYVDNRDVRASARLAPSYLANLDAATCEYVSGWVIDFNNKNTSPSVDLYIDGVKAATVPATVVRKDVADAYGIVGYNQYGFVYQIPASLRKAASMVISVRYLGTSQNILASPMNTVVCSTTVTNPPSTTVTNPPSTTVTNPPSTTVTNPPSTTVTNPPSTTVTTPPSSTTSVPTSATTVIPPVGANSNYYGFLDVATCDTIRGWIFDLNSLKMSIGVDIYINNSKIATILADRARPDVAAYFGIQGFNKYEYAYVVPASYRTGKAMTISVKPANTTRELINSPRTTAVCPALTLPPSVTAPAADTCQFTISASVPASVSCGSAVSLKANCEGANCGRVSYKWTGSGTTTTGQSVSLTAPTTAGTYNYTLTAAATGCASKTLTGAISVTCSVPPSTTVTNPPSTTVTNPPSTTVIPPVGANSNYYGFLDVATCDTIRGWIFDLNSLKMSIGVDIYINNSKIATILADRARPDVAAYFGIQGFNKYEYAYVVPASYRTGKAMTISVKPANTTRELINSPRTTAVCPALTLPPSVTAPAADTCQFTISASVPASVSCGSAVSLKANCEGANCGRVSYKWAASGLTTTAGQSVSLTAPSAAGSVSYTVTASATGCASQTLSGAISVTCPAPPSTTVTNPPSTTVTPKFQGFLETLSCEGAGGWVIDLNNPKTSPVLDVLLNGVKVATITADRARQDVADAYGIKGYNAYGYFYAIPDAYKSNATIKVSIQPTTTGRDLSLSPRTTAVCAGSGKPPVVTVPPSVTAPAVDSCQFTLSTSVPASVSCGSPLSLKANCDGINCGRVTYKWTGNGVTTIGQSINLTAPATAGTYAYTVTASATGCASQTLSGAISVTCPAPPSTTITSPPVSATATPRYQGFLEGASCEAASGWILDLNNPQTVPSVDILLNGIKVATVKADRARQDVADAYGVKGNNMFGYYYVIPDAYKSNATIKVQAQPTTTGRDLTLSPRITAVCPGTGQAPVESKPPVVTVPPSVTAPAPLPDSCQFSLNTSPISISCGTAVTLRASCDRATYSWTGGGATLTGQQVTLPAPTANGTITYTVTASATGCPSQSATFDLITTGCSSATAPPTTTNPPTTTPVVNANYKGFLEAASCEAAIGWILDLNNPQTVPSVDILLNGIKVATVKADRARQDVADAYGVKGNNMFGYYYVIPDAYKSNATLKVQAQPAGTGTELTLSPRVTAFCSGTGLPPTTSPPSTATGCQFAVTANSINAACGSTVTLSANCTGSSCDRLTYTWSGPNLNQTGKSVTFNAPASNSLNYYTVTASASGCSSQSATVTVTVTGCATAPTDQGAYPILSSPYPSDKRPILQNERIRLGVDLGVGGVIREVTDLQVGENMINCMVWPDGHRDGGRDDQISLYGMPNAAQGWTVNGKPILDDIGYNPVQGGDIAGNFSPMLGYGRTDQMIYTKTRNLLWGINNEPGHYVVEQWIRLDGNVVKRHVRITGDRPDNTKYDDSRQQEMPCTYTNSAYYQYYSVQGDPYTNAPTVNINSIENLGGSGTSLNRYNNRGQMGPLNVDTSEPWIAAIRPNTGRGMAIHTPFSHEFKAALFNEVGWGPPEGISAGYIANCMHMILDPKGVYEFDINMIVGTLSEIRNTVNILPRSETKPNYVFDGNPTRHGFSYRKGYDQGFPIQNELVITPTDRRFKIVSPWKGYRASEIPTLYVRMRAITTETTMVLEWRKVGQTELEAAQANQVLRFNVRGDNQYQTIAIPTGQAANWNGVISTFSIRYDNVSETPVNNQQFGVKYISATNLGDL